MGLILLQALRGPDIPDGEFLTTTTITEISSLTAEEIMDIFGKMLWDLLSFLIQVGEFTPVSI